MDDLSEVLRDHNLKVTPQRLCVYTTLTNAKKHLSAEEICNLVHDCMPAVSLATVYSILEQLIKNNLVQEIKIDFERSLFESKIEKHHHFLCNKCKKIYDIEMHPCPSLKRKEVDGHLINDFHGYFYGECKTCKNQK